MRSYTFDIIKRDTKQDNLYNIFSTSIIDQPIQRLKTYVYEGEECRLDLVSKRLYLTTIYEEELMVINNIINKFSISVGDEIEYVDNNAIQLFRSFDVDDGQNSEKVANQNKSTRVDPNRQSGVPPTIRPLDFEQMMVDKKNQTIKLNTKLS